MTAPETRWTADTEQMLVARNHEAECGGPIEDCVFLKEHREAARDALEILAGLEVLLPPGGKTRVQYGTVRPGFVAICSKTRANRVRSVYTGPWIEVPS